MADERQQFIDQAYYFADINRLRCVQLMLDEAMVAMGMAAAYRVAGCGLSHDVQLHAWQRHVVVAMEMLATMKLVEVAPPNAEVPPCVIRETGEGPSR